MQAMQTWWPMSSSLKIGLGLLFLAQSLDVVTTLIGLHLGIPEGNPVMNLVLHRQGELAMYGLKVALVAAAILLIGSLRWPSQRVWPLLLIMTLPAIVVVISNLALIAAAHA